MGQGAGLGSRVRLPSTQSFQGSQVEVTSQGHTACLPCYRCWLSDNTAAKHLQSPASCLGRHRGGGEQSKGQGERAGSTLGGPKPPLCHLPQSQGQLPWSPRRNLEPLWTKGNGGREGSEAGGREENGELRVSRENENPRRGRGRQSHGESLCQPHFTAYKTSPQPRLAPTHTSPGRCNYPFLPLYFISLFIMENFKNTPSKHNSIIEIPVYPSACSTAPPPPCYSHFLLLSPTRFLLCLTSLCFREIYIH